MKKAISLLLAVLMIAALAACGGNTAAPKATEAPAAEAPAAEAPAAEAPEVIKIGYIGDLTGGTALWGTSGMYGAQAAVEKVNADGGVLGGKMLELVAMDGKGEAADSVNAFQKLVQSEGIVASIGTNFSSCNIPMASVADQVKVPIIGTAASNELVTIDESGNLHPYSFRMCFIDSYLGTAIGSYCTKDLGLTKAALFTIAGNTNSESVGACIEEAFTANGGEIVSNVQGQEGDVDFRAQLTKIKSSEPEVIFVIMNDYAKIATFAKQAREMGIDCLLMGHDGWDSAELITEAQGALEGCMNVSRLGFSDPAASAFGDEIAQKHNTSKETECLFGWDGVMWLVDAMERAGSADPTAIRDALEATEVFEGYIGTLVMDPETHNPTMACAVFTFQGEERVFTAEIAAQ